MSAALITCINTARWIKVHLLQTVKDVSPTGEQLLLCEDREGRSCWSSSDVYGRWGDVRGQTRRKYLANAVTMDLFDWLQRLTRWYCPQLSHTYNPLCEDVRRAHNYITIFTYGPTVCGAELGPCIPVNCGFIISLRYTLVSVFIAALSYIW